MSYRTRTGADQPSRDHAGGRSSGFGQRAL